MENFNCDICKLNYKTRGGLQKHIRIYHKTEELKINKDNICIHCNKNFKHRQSKWRHEKDCKNIKTISLEDKVNQLTEKIKELESKPVVINNTLNTTQINQYIITPPGCESIGNISIETQREIMQKGLNSLTHLIQYTNFNKTLPENHSYCVTALNDKHASVINPDTNTVIKTDKITLFDKIMTANLKKLEQIAQNNKFTDIERSNYTDKLKTLKDQLFMNRKSLKRYYIDLNLISYNNRDLVFETWTSLKNIDDVIDLDFDDSEGEELAKKQQHLKETYEGKRPAMTIEELNQIDSNSELSTDTESEDEEPNAIEINIKGKYYLLEKDKVYIKNSSDTKGELYGLYVNGKIKKIIKNKEIDV
jgi:hypothetical protein